MRLLTSIILTTVIAITGCGIGQKSIVGKWDCKFNGIKQDNGEKTTIEYLADGTTIIDIVYSNKVSLKPSQNIGQWKSLEGNRISSVFNGKTTVTNYKLEGEKLLFKAADSEDYSIKCDRVK